MARLRVLLPCLAALHADHDLDYAMYLRDDRPAVQQGRASLATLGQRHAGAVVDAILHPADVTMTHITLPPLPSGQMRTAVSGMIEPYLLGDPATTVIGYGKRAANGRVGVAWLDRDHAHTVQHRLAKAGLHLRALWPTPFLLPLPGSGWTACLIDGYAVVRTGAADGFVFPVDATDTSGVAQSGVCRLLDHLRQSAPAYIAWQDAVPLWWPATEELSASAFPAPACWAAPRAPWGLDLREVGTPRSSAHSWGRAAAWTLGGVLAWLIGLNLYASRLAHAGHALETENASLVQETFPSLRTIVDPLRQAQQQWDAQQAAEARNPNADLAFLLAVAGQHMPFAQGQVRSVRFGDGALDVDLAAGAGAPTAPTLTAAAHAAGAAATSATPPPLPAWAGAVLQAGAQVEATATGWRLRRAPEGTLPPRPAATATLARTTP